VPNVPLISPPWYDNLNNIILILSKQKLQKKWIHLFYLVKDGIPNTVFRKTECGFTDFFEYWANLPRVVSSSLPCKSSRTLDARKIPFTLFLIWLLVCLICEGHGGGRKPSKVSCRVDGLCLLTLYLVSIW
jgi:hypothetical protein